MNQEKLVVACREALSAITTEPDGKGGFSIYNIGINGKPTPVAILLRKGIAEILRSALATEKGATNGTPTT